MHPGSNARLKGTTRTYAVEALYCTGALNPANNRETWARLRAPEGHVAYWNVEKLIFEGDRDEQT